MFALFLTAGLVVMDSVAAVGNWWRPTFPIVDCTRPVNLPELMQTLKEYKLEPKRMQMVQPYRDKEPNMVLLEAVLGGGPQLTVLPALVVYESDGSYTRQVLDMYGKP